MLVLFALRKKLTWFEGSTGFHICAPRQLDLSSVVLLNLGSPSLDFYWWGVRLPCENEKTLARHLWRSSPEAQRAHSLQVPQPS